ncbi:xylulokinase [Roseibium sediminis]|uniref:xylulokinase n=1 Tax=Roseibium sediminis TaxID=1775174 RepID=UPI00123E3A74|nr:FGGY-family carbohydrate kinase [Roseibium sediminis]
MNKDIVIGLDSSTQTAKAIAWNASGEAIAEGRAAIGLSMPQSGWVEQDVEEWWGTCCSALNEVTAKVGADRIAGLAISNQRETVSFINSQGRAVRPGIVWLDERSKKEVAELPGEFEGNRLHAITGKPADLTPVIYRLEWMRRNAPEVLEATAKILDVHGFLTGRLTGTQVASWTSADPFGVFDIAAKAWSQEILDHLRLRPNQFADLAKPGARIGEITSSASSQTGLLAGTPVFAGGGDGQCAGLGVNGARPGVVFLNLGTALITGAWSREPRISHNWRTMTSPTGEGYFLEGCLRAGAFLLNWFVDTFAGGRANPGVFASLEAEAEKLPIGSEGVLVCPYLSGCMDPHWDPSARASFSGLAPGHGLGHLYRAILEALTLESARAIAAMREAGLKPQKIIAVGGGGNSRLWTQMYADATGLPLAVSRSLEASSLGAAMAAAVGLGWYSNFDAAASAMSAEEPEILPNTALRGEWDELSRRQAAAYRPTF